MNAQRVTMILPANVLTQLDEFAFSEHRSRSNAATLLLAEALEHRATKPTIDDEALDD